MHAVKAARNAKGDSEGRGGVHPDFKPPAGHLPRIDFGQKQFQELSEEALERRLTALKGVWIELAREDFCAFMEYVFQDPQSGVPFVQQWFHDEWSLAMDKEERLLIIAPRGHGKTTQVIGRTLWELGRNHNLRIKIACASDTKAMDRLYEIRQHLEGNERLRQVFPDLLPDEQAEWSKHKLVVKRTAKHKDASIEAQGIATNVTGGRSDIVIADDIVSRQNSMSETQRETVKKCWKGDWSNTLEPGARIWAICTLWHKDDLNHELMKNEVYKTLFYAVPEDFGSLWPDRWSEARLRYRCKEIGSVEFNRGFRNIATDDTTAIVKEGWILYKAPPEPSKLAHIMSYDTAKGTKEINDYTASVTAGVDVGTGDIYIVDAWHAKLTVIQQREKIATEAKAYAKNLVSIQIETVGLSSIDEWVVEEYPELAGLVEPVNPGSRGPKDVRLQNVTPFLENGQVYFAPHLDPDNPEWISGRGNIVGELLDFPIGAHDDLVDAFSQCLFAVKWYLFDRRGNAPDEISIVLGGRDGDGDFEEEWLI